MRKLGEKKEKRKRAADGWPTCSYHAQTELPQYLGRI